MKSTLIVIGMALATVLPRIVPVIVMDQEWIPGWLNRTLNCIPPAVMAALIFPGIIHATPSHPMIGLAGGVTAAITAYFGYSLLHAILSALGVVLLFNLF